MEPRLDMADYGLRPLAGDDAPAMARHADDPLVACNMRDRFPHPYQLSDAVGFMETVLAGGNEQAWAIDYLGECVGVVGIVPGRDVYTGSWEIGYWLGREHWGRGVATATVKAVSEYLFRSGNARRIWAGVFSGNPASVRVLEKAGYTLEGIHRDHLIKAGEVRDELVFARLAPTSNVTK